MTLNDSLTTLELLSVPLVGLSEVKATYRRLQKKWHPDLHIGKETFLTANKKAIIINSAYEIVTEYVEANGPIKNIIKPSAERTEKRKEYKPKHQWENGSFELGFPDETVFEIFVKSSNIISIAYNKLRKVLFIKFQGNSIYEYEQVHEEIFRELFNAESHGKYAHRKIYNNYRYRRCTEPNRPYKSPSLGVGPTLCLAV